uniref:Uncharacterized protein n=1 Tax=Anguilla anguilla TaxID=7936 RepID=A0A0E9RGY3_ANGAN
MSPLLSLFMVLGFLWQKYKDRPSRYVTLLDCVIIFIANSSCWKKPE